MNRKVVLSKTAQKRLEKLFVYLEETWSEKVKLDFIEKLDAAVAIIKTYPKSFPESKKGKKLRRCVITKQTTLYYRFTNKQISVVTLFDTRQHPKTLEMEVRN